MPPRTLRVLLVEDNPTDALLVEASLEEMTALAPELVHVELLAAAKTALQKAAAGSEFDLVLLDLNLPDGNGLGNFEQLHAVAPNVPIIVLTGLADQEMALGALSCGAADYLIKGATDAPLLERAARYAIERKRSENDRLEIARLQIAGEEASANSRAKDEFLATLSHELRTPLNAIMGWASLLKSGQLDAETSAQAVETIERNARIQAQLIEDLLDVSRIIAGNFKLELSDGDLENVVRAAASTLLPLIQNKQIDLQIEVAAPSPVRCDAMRMQQVAWNLISNAVKFSGAGSTVRVTVGNTTDLPAAKVGSGTAQPDRNAADYSVSPSFIAETGTAPGAFPQNEVFFQIRDEGAGIAPEFLPHVFERFRQADSSTTRRFGGLGLGLAIVRNVVELHGGRVVAQSEGVGRGATFSVFLPAETPVSPDAPRHLAHPCDDDAPPWTSATILVVADQSEGLDFPRTLFEKRGARVETALGSREALGKVALKVPQLLIIDTGLAPDDFALLETLRARGHAMPVVALTSTAHGEGRARALAAGFAACFAKPLDAKVLCQCVAKLLHFAA